MKAPTASAGLVLLMACAVCAAARGDATTQLQGALRACANELPGAASGLQELERRCPALQSALAASALRPLIIESSRSRLYRDSLRQLADLAHAPAGPVASTAVLDSILRQGAGRAGPARSWWQRLWDWLAAHLSLRQARQSDSTWLRDLGRALGHAEWFWSLVIRGMLVGLPVAVTVIVVREVRALGRRSRDQTATTLLARGPGRSESQLAVLRQAPLSERPARLFGLLVTRLVAAGRLPPDRSLTHREVVRKARLDDMQQRQLLESLARVSERQLYAADPAAPAGLEELLARAEDLYTVGWSPP